MKIKKYITVALNFIYILIAVLFILDNLNSFDIKSQSLKSFTYFGIMILSPLLLIWNLLMFKSKWGKIKGIILPTLFLVAIISIGPLKLLFHTASWKTQSILYRNGHFKFKRVEFQIQDIGSFGYNKRTVEVIYLTGLFMIVGKVDPNIDKKVEWVKVNEDLNEQGLK